MTTTFKIEHIIETFKTQKFAESGKCLVNRNKT